MNPCGHPRAKFVLLPLFVLVVLTLLTFVVRGLWNGVLVDAVSVVKPVGYWQAFGLLVLAKILFGGFPRRGRYGGPDWKSKWEHCASLTPEQREAAREEMKRRFGRWGAACSPRSHPPEDSVK